MQEEQKSKSTVKTYLRAVALFFTFLQTMSAVSVNNAVLQKFKENLTNSLASASSNTYIVALNSFLAFINFNGKRIKCIKWQSKDYVAYPLNDAEYGRLMDVARGVGGDTAALFKTLAGTGIRVSELKFVTVEAVKNGCTEVNNKGKIRTLYISDNLRQYLLDYCLENQITEGVIFTGRDGVSPLSASAVWKKINSLSEKTGIEKKKLFPHNLRHFYASKFMKIVNDLNVLRDLLGHSDIKTTTIYTHPDGDYIRCCVNKIAV